MSLKFSKCDYCKNLNKEDERNFPVCKAFPDGIPVEKEAEDETAVCTNGIKFEEEL